MIYSDHGSGFLSGLSKTLMSELAITHVVTTERDNRQNRNTERFNRTIMNTAHTLFIHNGLEVKCWPEEAAFATMVLSALQVFFGDCLKVLLGLDALTYATALGYSFYDYQAEKIVKSTSFAVLSPDVPNNTGLPVRHNFLNFALGMLRGYADLRLHDSKTYEIDHKEH
ncbi:hypothetical protein ACO0QE_000167 [Hanseniaspora vineae]